MNGLARLGATPWYWLAVLLGALILEGVALYHQYELLQYPCMLCIHVRIWVAAFALIGIIGLVVRRWRTSLIGAHVLSVIAAIGLLERSWMTLGTEKGWVDGACRFTAGLPDWFALDRWLPLLFEVQGPCARTPAVLFGVTMAEALIVISVAAVIATLAMLAATLRHR